MTTERRKEREKRGARLFSNLKKKEVIKEDRRAVIALIRDKERTEVSGGDKKKCVCLCVYVRVSGT